MTRKKIGRTPKKGNSGAVFAKVKLAEINDLFENLKK
jgi:hypothetical protein